MAAVLNLEISTTQPFTSILTLLAYKTSKFALVHQHEINLSLAGIGRETCSYNEFAFLAKRLQSKVRPQKSRAPRRDLEVENSAVALRVKDLQAMIEFMKEN